MRKSLVDKIYERRDKKIIKAYLSGELIEYIEEDFGISKARIYQILKKYLVELNRKK